MTHLRDLMSSQPWWSLAPDVNRTTLVDRFPWWGERSMAAVTTDSEMAMVYVPVRRSATIDLSSLKGPFVRSTWFDPTDGSFIAATGATLSARGTRAFTPPGPNTAGDSDWLLILESVPTGTRVTNQ